ncbi:hypothetical protein COI34_09200 [Neisseria meningitidis]|nr:hypothetical protein COI34_09200 [Neisseria meningitidis]RQK87229.1 hypothetical protein COH51_04300 [Neisseria meningitidis]RQL01823.1 hypothetical protein COH44_04670 [Neisseria meningitidis]
MFCILRRFGGVDYFLLCKSFILVFYCQFKKKNPDVFIFASFVLLFKRRREADFRGSVLPLNFCGFLFLDSRLCGNDGILGF